MEENIQIRRDLVKAIEKEGYSVCTASGNKVNYEIDTNYGLGILHPSKLKGIFFKRSPWISTVYFHHINRNLGFFDTLYNKGQVEVYGKENFKEIERLFQKLPFEPEKIELVEESTRQEVLWIDELLRNLSVPVNRF